MTRLYIVRHCETMGNHLKVFQGNSDFEVSPIGEKQIAALGERFKNVDVDVIYSSPLPRAVKTAAAIAQPKGLEIITHNDLREIHGGIIEGKHLSDIFINHRELEDTWNNSPQDFAPENGESMRSVYARVSACVDEILRKNKDKNIVVVSHGGAIRNLVCYLMYGDIERLNDVPWCDNTAVALVEFDDAFKPNFRYKNCTSHLSEELLPVENRISAWTEDN